MNRRRRKSRKKTNSLLSVLIVLIFAGWGLYTQGGLKPNGSNLFGEFSDQFSSTTNEIDQANKAQQSYGGLANSDYQKLASLNFKSGNKAYVFVNHNHSTLIKNA